MRYFFACMCAPLAWAVLVSASISALAAPDEWSTCTACHGANAEGNRALKAPALAGQRPWYLVRQLENFATGVRGAHPEDTTARQMRPFAEALDGPQRERLANYLSALEPVSRKGSRQGNLMNGSRYYHARCGSCHGGKGEGNEAFQAPRLQGLSDQYLTRQMRYFQEGIRGNHEADKYGRQMGLMANTVSDAELHDILYFLAEQH
ncbi:MAG: c-type cytochrome [Wenzhouxiangellaceae bacterium]